MLSFSFFRPLLKKCRQIEDRERQGTKITQSCRKASESDAHSKMASYSTFDTLTVVVLYICRDLHRKIVLVHAIFHSQVLSVISCLFCENILPDQPINKAICASICFVLQQL